MPSLIDWHVAIRSLASESGDQYLVRPTANGVLVAVVDGLGHGPDAAGAAKAALAELEAGPPDDLSALIARCHESVRGTRGVVLSLALFAARTLMWLGVGNVDGVLLRAVPPGTEHLLVRGGVVGGRLPSLEVSRMSIGRGDTLILATDGVDPAFAKGADLTRLARPTAERILVDHGKNTDDALVMVVRYVGSEA